MKISVRTTGLPLCRVATLPVRAVRMMGTAAHVSPGSSPMAMPPRFDIQAAQNTKLRVQPRCPPPRQSATSTQPAASTQVQPTARQGPTMPPGFKAEYGSLPTFTIPETVTSTPSHVLLGQQIITAFRRDGIIQIAQSPLQRKLWQAAQAASRRFFAKSPEEKAVCVDSQSYAGYIASGEEVTDGIADYSEIFTITKDFDMGNARVRAKWPCHGPVPWPDVEMREPMMRYKEELGREGARLVRLFEMGLGLEEGELGKWIGDDGKGPGGWHHARVLRFPPRNATNGKGKEGRGIGSHTDYGLLVISAQDDVGGLFIRRPSQEEKFANWEKSAAGLKEDDDGWVFIPPVEGTHTVILGDMMQYLTRNHLVATPHKVGLNTRERFAFAYFHEPSFQAVLKPLNGGVIPQAPPAQEKDEGVHYGTHFTNMFIRNYPDRITTKRLVAEGRYGLLERPELRTIGAAPTAESRV
ncbi:putative 2-oxoglutarate-dependent ethylene/succinate [Triangularia verruculosa]|uniref:2-oxoglutarate-dependent ethylene/succinate n=1 Tax=Triangularia verruculosa TaxID=2587418 RepID=A0AAN7AWV3_9PEZI|nr:putative 2-oxoglutarate-dependent ethylene/succinate [Triangularia verruculosa]